MMREHKLTPLISAIVLGSALLFMSTAGANDPPAEAKPSSIKPGVAPEAGSMSPLKAKLAEGKDAKADAHGKPAEKTRPNTDEALRKLLAERVAGSGEVILTTSDHKPAATAATAAAPRKRALAVEQKEAAEHVAHWSYSGAGGPENWGKLSPENNKCATGTRQSPIDIRDGVKVELAPVKFDYQAGGYRVVDNGHTIQVNVAPGSTIEVLGRRYDLVQYHFHKPAEERVNGRAFDMVVHLVHKDIDGRLAVVAVLLNRGGAAQSVIQAVWNNLPLERSEDVAVTTPIDVTNLLPEDRRYFTYMGSLTTPPCSEGVLWMVMKTPVQISAEQIAIFSHLYPMNARPTQPASARLIKESN